jgi:hypothetical protein
VNVWFGFSIPVYSREICLFVLREFSADCIENMIALLLEMENRSHFLIAARP